MAIGLAFVAGLGVMLFVFSIGTAVVNVPVEVEVLDRRAQAPVSNCRLVFERGESTGSGQATLRSDAQGRLTHTTSHSYVGSIWPFPRERLPALRFYLGEAPRYGSYDEVESWQVRLRFDEPLFGNREIEPQLTVERSLAHETVLDPPPGRKWRQAGFDALPTEPDHELARATVRFESGPDGRKTYRISLTILLDERQGALCQAESPYDCGGARGRALERPAATLRRSRPIGSSRP